ncbi:hypothetical protein BLA60_02960 [Actinophytocola xinjiangensis]|uniref:Uncharacterized protein n=1 Tax=Actinophytocola xinjiangensis TaxID=485602 RepID=A0A7Z0WUC8_9PSEU|nr:hypothetical protein [Actinophytocola xinjiangensis]OLF14136.1 hypothetical protein BLA60_02960 [Actinophytocola xinjiangensis]
MAAVDAQRRPAMRWAVVAAVAVLAVVLAAGGALLVTRDGLDEQLGRRVVAALERPDADLNAGDDQHAGHDPASGATRRVSPDGHELRCATEVFGHEPVDATSVEEVTVVYAHRMCAAVGPGLVWPDSIRETGPVAVRLGIPDTLVLPERSLLDDPDANYVERIRSVVPQPFRDAALAFRDYVDPDVAQDLQDLVED